MEPLFESANETVRGYVANTLYPPAFDGSMGYTNQRERTMLFRTEIVLTCNIRYLHSAMNTSGYAYMWEVTPSLHLGDVLYVFWNGPQNFSPIKGTISRTIQDYITTFAITGNPNNDGSPSLEVYDGTTLRRLLRSGYDIVADPTNTDRYSYLQGATYWDRYSG